MRKWLPALALSTAFVSSVLAAPQAMAQNSKPVAEKVPGTNVEFSPSAARDPQTRALAAADPAAVEAGGLLCGSGYQLGVVNRLPDSRRFGTLFTYIKWGPGGRPGRDNGACAVFDNNLGFKEHIEVPPTCGAR
ncbi:hypothetical protein ACWC2T_45945 [Streptomyces sp. NPDC001393]